MRVLYFITRGANDPTGASLPLHLAANGSLAVGHNISVVLAGDGRISPDVPPARRSTGWACRTFVTSSPRLPNIRSPSTSDGPVGSPVG
jgi:hypothetical protein